MNHARHSDAPGVRTIIHKILSAHQTTSLRIHLWTHTPNRRVPCQLKDPPLQIRNHTLRWFFATTLDGQEIPNLVNVRDSRLTEDNAPQDGNLPSLLLARLEPLPPSCVHIAKERLQPFLVELHALSPLQLRNTLHHTRPQLRSFSILHQPDRIQHRLPRIRILPGLHLCPDEPSHLRRQRNIQLLSRHARLL